MSYYPEQIDDEGWEAIRQRSDILRAMAKRPSQRVVSSENGNFLVESGSEHSRDEWMISSVFVSSARSIRLTISDPQYGKFRAEWRAWDGIEESEIANLNNEITKAVVALYPFTSAHLDVRVSHSPYAQMPKETLIGLFDAQVGSWYAYKRYKLIVKRTKELKRGVHSPLMWRFYWTKWKGVTYTAIEKGLLAELSYLFTNPRHLVELLNHLDSGGEGFSDDSKRVLNYLRNKKRMADLFAYLPRSMRRRLNLDYF